MFVVELTPKAEEGLDLRISKMYVTRRGGFYISWMSRRWHVCRDGGVEEIWWGLPLFPYSAHLSVIIEYISYEPSSLKASHFYAEVIDVCLHVSFLFLGALFDRGVMV
jgi:hypothetical protein